MSVAPARALLVLQHPHQEVAVRDRAMDLGGAQRRCQPPRRGLPRRSPRQHLREHGVVVRGDLGAVDVPGIDPHAVTGAEREPVESAGRGQVARVHVLGVEPGLDGVPEHRRVPRLGRERTPFRDRELERDEVETGHQLGDGVLHLESRVHLQEPERAVGREHELDGSRVHVADRPRRR